MAVVLVVEGVSKAFQGVQALDSVSLHVNQHEIVGLVGENGAGKSTLMKVLIGLHQPDSGRMILSGNNLVLKSTHDGKLCGIGMVFQEQSVLKNMTVFENLFIGHEQEFRRFGILSKKRMITEARSALQAVGLDISPSMLLFDLSFMQRQMVEIARIIWFSRECGIANPLIILDEPTTMLEQKDIDALFRAIIDLRTTASLIYISHRLREVVDICDRVYVLKDGRNAGEFAKGELSEDLLRARMVGREFHGEYYLIAEQRQSFGRTLLQLKDCSKGKSFRGVSFELHEGEILSICGTVGSGKEDLCKCIFGVERLSAGDILREGRKITLHSPADAFRWGIGFVPEDRRYEGIISNMSIYDNITLPILGRMRKGIFIQRGEQLRISEQTIEKLKIKTESAADACATLSGGNQQKVILSKWLLSGVRVIILSHPTRGVDVGAKHEIYTFIRELARDGKALIVLGDSFEEEIGLANRILVMKDGEPKTFIDATERKPSPQELLAFMV